MLLHKLLHGLIWSDPLYRSTSRTFAPSHYTNYAKPIPTWTDVAISVRPDALNGSCSCVRTIVTSFALTVCNGLCRSMVRATPVRMAKRDFESWRNAQTDNEPRRSTDCANANRQVIGRSEPPITCRSRSRRKLRRPKKKRQLTVLFLYG